MSKNLILILPLLVFVNWDVSAQNTFPTTGNVGVGTTTPSDIFEVAKSSISKIKFYTPSNYSYPTDFGTGIIGMALTRLDGIYTGGIYSYNSKTSNDNLAIGSRSEIVFLTGYAGLGNQPEVMRLNNNGSMGLGTSTPIARLDVGKLLASGELGTVLGHLSEGNTTGDGTFLGVRGYETQGSDYNNIKSFGIEHDFYGATNNSINFYRGLSVTGGSISLNTGDNTERVRILGNGNVGIGTQTPQASLDVIGNIFSNGKIVIGTTDLSKIGTNALAVNGSAIINKVTVKPYPWSDYVFDKNYPLPKLPDLENFIKEKHHLPDVPTANEVEKNGIDIGLNQSLLLKKIEELTLIIIDLNKKIDGQNIRIEKIEMKVK